MCSTEKWWILTLSGHFLGERSLKSKNGYRQSDFLKKLPLEQKKILKIGLKNIIYLLGLSFFLLNKLRDVFLSQLLYNDVI